MIKKWIRKNVRTTTRECLWEGRSFIAVSKKVDEIFDKDTANRIIEKLHDDMPFVERDKIRIQVIEFTYEIDK